MKSQGLPMSTIVLLIIVLIAVAVGIAFVFTSSVETKNQTGEFTEIGEEGAEQSADIIERALFKSRCDMRCTNAKSLARSKEKDEVCKGSGLKRSRIQDSNFCDEVIFYNDEYLRCDEYYLRTGEQPCKLSFKDIITELTCDFEEEKC
jgi:hypothetical protein